MTLPLVFPPSSLPKFSASGHGIRPGSDYAGVPRGKGHSRKRAKSTGAHRVVPVRWVLTAAQAAALDFWGEKSLNVWTRAFTAEVANQGPGRLFWRAQWAGMPRCIPQPTPRGVMWEVTGSLILTGSGEAFAPSTGELGGEIVIPRTGSATLLLPDTPLGGTIIIERIAITPLAGLIIIRRTSTLTPLAGVISIQRTGSGEISTGGGGGAGGTIDVGEDDGSPIQAVDTILFPPGSVSFDSNGRAVVSLVSPYDKLGGWEHNATLDPAQCAVQWTTPCKVAGTITAGRIQSDLATNATVEVYKDVFANSPPTVADKISASAPLTLTAATASVNTTMTGWTLSIAVGDVLGFKLLSNSAAKRIVASVDITP